ncbi:MAG: FCD domain-containing protein [Geminicoccaceae bacterium]
MLASSVRRDHAIQNGREAIKQEHEELLDAFRANDVEQADKVIRQHLAGSFTQMSQQMSALVR